MVWQQNPPAGWYPDPAGGGGRRYWDGGQWTGVASPPSTGTNGFAVAALILGIIGIFPVALIFGVLALRDIRRRGGGGRGLAIAGLAAAGVWGFLITAVIAINIVSPIPDESGTVAEESSEQIMPRALDAFRAAHTYRVRGQRTDGGATTLIDLSFDIDQPAAIETLRLGGHSVEIRRLADKIYIKADPEYWKQTVASEPEVWNASPDQVAAILQDKYLVAVPQEVASGADKTPAMLDQEIIYANQAFGAFLDGPTTLGTQTDLKGTAVVTIRNLNRDTAESLNAETLYLTATATPLPLRIEGPRGFLDFHDFGTPVTVTAPPTSQLVDIATLRGAPS